MSYSRDRDRYSRGVGAIAARDLAPGAKRRFAKRRAPVVRSMGDMATGECAMYVNGAYYVRRAGGQLEKVSPIEAARYPACDTGGRVSGLQPSSSTTSKLTSIPILTPKSYPGGPLTSPTSSSGTVSSGGYIGPVSGSMTPAPTSGSSVGPYTGSTLPVTTVVTVPPPPPTSYPTPTKTPIVSTATSAPGKLVSAPATTSVITTWTPTPPIVPTFTTPTLVDTSVSVPAPSSSPSPSPISSSSKSTLLWVGAGIGLLYLLTRK